MKGHFVSLPTTLRFAVISTAVAAVVSVAAPVTAATVQYQFDYATEPFVLDCATLDYANPYANFVEADVDYSLWQTDPVTANIFMADCIAAQAREAAGQGSGDTANTNNTSTTVTTGTTPAPSPAPTTSTQVLAAATNDTAPATLPRTGVSDLGYLLAVLLGSGGGIASYLRAKHSRNKQ